MHRSDILRWLMPIVIAIALATPPARSHAGDSDVPAPSIVQKLADVNALARAHYARAKAATLAGLGPIIVVEPDALTLVRDGKRQRQVYLPERYRSLKALAHVAMGLHSLAAPHAGKHDLAAWRDDLTAYRAQVAGLVPEITDLGLHWDDAKRQRDMLAAALAFMDRIAADGGVAGDALHGYANDVGPALQGNLYDAAEAELKSLDALVQRWRGELRPEEWSQLYVVVMGPARPRERHPPYDYFARLLGAGAETHLLRGDNVTEIDTALDLLATTVTDRRLGQDFFGDPHELDRGLMRPATTRHLDKMFQ
jgi:hypothetical protein